MRMMREFVGKTGAAWYYDDDWVIGDRGGYGEVFRGYYEDGARSVAVKRVRLQSGEEAERRLRNREAILADFLATSGDARTPTHIVVPLDHCVINDDLLIVMPLADRSLRQALKSGLSEGEKFLAARHIVLGMMELAERSVLHRDIKPANILQYGS